MVEVTEALVALGGANEASWRFVCRGNPTSAAEFAKDVSFFGLDGNPVAAPVTWDEVVNVVVSPPLDPGDELDAALAAIEGTDASVDDLIAVFRGRAGRAGRVAGRPAN